MEESVRLKLVVYYGYIIYYEVMVIFIIPHELKSITDYFS